MTAFSELVLLALSLGTLNSWNKNVNENGAYLENSNDIVISAEQDVQQKSLYDLMAHFPMDKDIPCPESDSRFRYPGECSRYVTCRNFQAHIRTCPPGMFFDESYGHCRLAVEVECYPSTCGPNEEYSFCNCERTCNTLHEDSDCEGECHSGCFCDSDYVRDDTGNCVKPEDCQNSLLRF